MKKILILTLLLLFSLIFGGNILSHVNEVKAFEENKSALDSTKKDNILSTSLEYIAGYNESNSYYGVYDAWQEINAVMPEEVVIIKSNEIIGGEAVLQGDSFGYQSDTVKAGPSDTISFNLEVTEEGLYEFYFDYYLLEGTLLRPTIAFEVNGEVQYNEMYNLDIPLRWKVEEDLVYDRFGDEITPNSFLESEWGSFALSDPNYFFVEPLKIYLPEGESEVTITVNEGFVLFGDITVGNLYEEASPYSEYQNSMPSATDDVETITLQAERYTYESKQNIRAKFVRNPSLTPYSYKNRVLNVLDQTSYRKSGDSVTYSFNVEETGYYNISLKYLQSENDGLSSARAIYIDGEIPFKEFENYSFDYTRSWKIETLHGDEDYKIYFEAGEHEITLTVYNSHVRDVYHQLISVLSDIDTIARDINKITGGLTDKHRDYKLDQYIPTLADDLVRLRDEVKAARAALIEIYDGSISAVSELDLAIKYFNQFIEDPDEIPPFNSRFNIGDGSIYGRINIILPTLIDSPLQLDAIYMHDENAELPNANSNIFVRGWEGIKAFFYSFFDPKYNDETTVDDETVVVWVRQSRLYIQVMQRMVDEGFSKDTGIKVQLSVMPDENKIILANAARNTPDAAMGLTVTRPFEFAIRDMIVDLSELDDFDEVASDFNPNSFIPYVYEGGVYSIPETMDVKLLFYRKDILEFLKTDPPQTWEEVVSLIPIMQKYNYYFYTPLGGDNAFKTFGETTPFIYQHHGDIYNETGNKVVINEEGAYDAFEFMTDLFSVYNVPITTSNFFQKFRDGQTPIGIGDGNMYIQLKYAAPELAGQWGVMPIPGIEYDKDETECPGPLTDGRCIERWDPTYGTSSVIFKDGNKQDKVWEYYKWWFSDEVQSDFTYQLQSLLGDEFLHMTANVDAFRTSAWPSDSKYEVIEQWQWIKTIGKVPGDYLVERELSNAWNKVVNDGINPRVAVDDAVVIINRELKRKLTEFGYYENGVLVKPYIVPTADNIHLWIKPRGDENE